jgi:tRNA modification GTPase
MDELRDAIAAQVVRDGTAAAEHGWAVNERHRRELELARIALDRAFETAGRGLSPELIALDLRDALDHLGMIVGATYTDDILERIFNEFCIGK